jgi:hypothetical protein
MQIKLACSAALPHKLVLLIEVDGGKVIDVDPQVDLPNNADCLAQVMREASIRPPITRFQYFRKNEHLSGSCSEIT